MIIDYLKDKNLQVLTKISSVVFKNKLPETVNYETIKEAYPPEDITADWYADSANRRFPCHNKLATYLSSIYFWGQKHMPWDTPVPKELVAQRLEKYARYWGILPKIRVLQKAASQKQAQMTKYALVAKYGDTVIKRYPIGTEERTIKSLNNFIKYRENYPYEWRKSAATTFLKHCITNRIAIQNEQNLSYLLKAAGTYPANKNVVVKNLIIRKELYPSEIKNKMATIVNLIKAGKLNDIRKVCILVDKVDRACKIHTKYASGVPFPEEICFSDIKITPVPSIVKLATGSVYNLDSIISAPVDISQVIKLPENIINNNTIDKVKFSNALENLPHASALKLDILLKNAGVKPVNE